MQANEPTSGPGGGGRAAGRARLPVIEHVAVELEGAVLADIARRAVSLRRSDPELDSTGPFGPHARAGLDPVPSLVVHDMKTVAAPGERPWTVGEYRGLLLARPGDAVAVWTPRSTAFEAYCRDVLGLGPVEVLRPGRPERPGGSLCDQCRRDPGVLDRLVDRAAAHGGLNVEPYMGTGSAWRLAAAIGERAGVPVSVAAPPPGLTGRVNDKLWFAERVAELLGEHALPPGAEAFSMPALAARVRELARRHERIVLKRPAAAAGLGNVVLDSEPLRDAPLKELRDQLGRFLARIGWPEPLPLLVSDWERPVLSSPSVQLWIPQPAVRTPLVEGVFEQQVSSGIGEFLGAGPSRLPGEWCRRLAREAVLLGALFQQLGYFGRCSLDAILVGPRLDAARLHWVECNGRWGGTSIPMTLVNRLTGDWARSPFVTGTDGPSWPFDEVLRRTEDRLFRPGADEGVVYLSPSDPAAGRGVDFVVVGRSPGGAERRARELAALRD